MVQTGGDEGFQREGMEVFQPEKITKTYGQTWTNGQSKGIQQEKTVAGK